ncbi:hypothetical protein CROQUDRAFT_17776, partial [Cronartium quercuum f. sp. fusiforme G11]
TLASQNPILIEAIHSIRWLSKPTTPGLTHRLILVNLLDKELLYKMEKGAVYFEGNSLQ